MKFILVKLVFSSVDDWPDTLNNFWTKLTNSFNLRFLYFIYRLADEMQKNFHQVKRENYIPDQFVSFCLILKLSLVSWLLKADGL